MTIVALPDAYVEIETVVIESVDTLVADATVLGGFIHVNFTRGA